MSRHRNLRHLADDYYEDDDYYDDYDDYDAKPAAPAPKRPAAKKSPPRSATTTPKKQLSSTPPPSAKKAAATPAAVATPPPPGFSLTPPPTAAAAAAVTTASEKVPANNSSSANTNTNLVERLQARGWLDKNASTTATSTATTRKRARIPYTLVVLGHVDAGKSTLLGHLLHQDSNTAGNTSNNNTNWAHVLDSTTAEQERGITMDLAVRTLETDRYAWLVQDAPGHADFVTQAVTGVSLAEVAVAVVDASSSLTEFIIPRQLREHLVLSRGLGVSQIIVAVNKLEVVNWSAPVYQQICASLTQFLVATLGYGQQQVRFVPVSGLLGINLKHRPADCPLLTAWYNGPTLYQALDQCTAPPYFNGALLTVVPKIMLKPTRVVVVDVPGEQGAAVMVRAKVIQGWLQQQQRLVLLPIGDAVTVQRLHNLLQDDKAAVAGEMVDLLLAGTDVARLAVGHVLVAMPLPVVASSFRGKLIVLDTVTVPIIPGATALFYCHTLHLPCTVAQFKPRVLTANMQAVVTIVLSSSIVLETFSSNKTMGRFILRRQGVTIAMGIIEEILP
jgi:elongation factor 1 alpha-like protein